MRRTFLTVAIATCFVSLGGAVAQDLPQTVIDLGLTNIETRMKPRAEYGRNVHGTLPGGSRVEIDLDRNNVIKEIEARGDGLFPISSVQSLAPVSVTKNPSWLADGWRKLSLKVRGASKSKVALPTGANSMPNSPPMDS